MQELCAVAKSFRSRSWESTAGTILKSWAEGEENGYRPNLTYAYTVNNQSYEGTAIAMGGLGIRSDLDSVKWALAEYPVGKQARVYYDPTRPTDAVLIPGPHATTFTGLIMCLAMSSFLPLFVWPIIRLRTAFPTVQA